MTTFRLLLAEIRYRKVNFALSVSGVMIAVALFVAAPVLVDGYQRETQKQVGRWEDQVGELKRSVAEMRDGMARVETETAAELARLEKETRRLMRDMGFNLLIVHRDTNMNDFWAADFAANHMPQQRQTPAQELTIIISTP